MLLSPMKNYNLTLGSNYDFDLCKFTLLQLILFFSFQPNYDFAIYLNLYFCNRFSLLCCVFSFLSFSALCIYYSYYCAKLSRKTFTIQLVV
ncbi:hypothetical protein Hanom_Chr14g01292741 [Helianthus anomalus]